MDSKMHVRGWRKSLGMSVGLLITAIIGYFLFFAALRSMNEHISRCLDQSAPKYIADSEQRGRECGSE
ncbi:hypothetical protein [Bosea sp. (in: a-proteobacteria)]|uniref:hypothetical protein n=1 Tax=Bosea sp. (in: a-proteobacteria) TaxID=1871050 RepID=UPI003B3AE703